MRIKFFTTIILTGSVTLSGCSHTANSFYGPPRPIQAGKIGGENKCPAEPVNIESESLESHFRAKACLSLKKPMDHVRAEAMYEAGFRLVHARCNDFFAQKAGTQLGINTAFDSVAPIVALLTGILSISNVADSRRRDYESALAFGSTALTAGLKVYETNFLFAAENTESVRKLTVDTLNQHANSVRTKFSEDSHSFYTSTQYVIENQMICTPGKMRDLVQGAINNQKFAFSARGTGDEDTATGDGSVSVAGGGGERDNSKQKPLAGAPLDMKPVD
ncbi:hypothetical protein ACRAQ7_03220 [Erythrobacter sp. W53]|uniref:hypothetical protein n=1 Tax=Erythrobacter sp. W53 TaxID=3425947 RepID=UPI003D76704B